MDNSSTNPSLLEDIGETIGYVDMIIDRKVKLAKLSANERITLLTSSMATSFLLLCVFFIIIGMFSIALGFVLAETMNWSYALSFFTVTGIYMGIGIVLYLLRHKLFTNPIMQIVLKKLF